MPTSVILSICFLATILLVVALIVITEAINGDEKAIAVCVFVIIMTALILAAISVGNIINYYNLPDAPVPVHKQQI